MNRFLILLVVAIVLIGAALVFVLGPAGTDQTLGGTFDEPPFRRAAGLDDDNAVAGSVEVVPEAVRMARRQSSVRQVVPGSDLGTRPVEADAHSAPVSGYELSRLSAGAVAVNLKGGSSPFTSPPSFQKEARTLNRILSGLVLDQDDRPVDGALVMAGKHMRTLAGSLVSNWGVQSGPSGQFEMPVESDVELVVVALHDRDGWSAPVFVPAGDRPEQLELRLHGTGTISGKVTRFGQPENAVVQVSDAKGRFVLDTRTDQQGAYRLESIPAGQYKLAAGQALALAGGFSAKKSVDVAVEPGDLLRHDFVLQEKLLLAVEAVVPEGVRFKWIAYFLFNGSRQPANGEEAKALEKAERGNGARFMLLGGQDSVRLMQFHDLLPGQYTLCGTVALDSEDGGELFGCQPVVMDDQTPVKEVKLVF